MAEQSVEWSYKLQCNQAATWRERVGNWLRRLAGKVDGRSTMALRLTTTPPLDRATRAEIFRQGFAQMDRSVRASCTLAAQEQLLRIEMPHLFAEPPSHG